MNPQRFDAISRLFAGQRRSRRQMWSALAGTPTAPGKAQVATPIPVPVKTTVPDNPYLFVQSFQKGAIGPKTGSAETFELTLAQGLGQTIYFTDRPERKVGATPTPKFLKGMNFSAANPPNAALVMEAEPGDIDIAVLELTNPRYDTETNTATYDATPLKDYGSTLEMGFQEEPKDLSALTSTFGAAHLLIDDCPDSTVVCSSGNGNYPCPNGDICGIFGPMGFCYSMGYGDGCFPCEPYDHQNPHIEMVLYWWTKKCNATFPICAQVGDGGGCIANF